MTQRTAGIISLVLFDLAGWISVIAAFLHSPIAGLICIAAVGNGVVLVLSSFCVKCSCKDRCPHVVPGLAASLFSTKPSTPYTHHELTFMIAGMLLIVGVPQVWMIGRTAWFGSYWLCMGIGAIIVRLYVCNACTHIFCPVNPKKSD